MGFTPLLVAAASACIVTDADRVIVRDGVVRVRDLVELHCLAPGAQGPIGDLNLAALPRRANAALLDRRAIADLARRRAPILGAIAFDPGAVRVERRDAIDQAPAVAPCYRTSQPLSAGEAVSRAALSVSACEAAAPLAPLVFDRTSATTRAQQDLPSGVYVGRLLTTEKPAIEAGSRLTFVAQAGPVRIERPVKAMQAARPGQALFVRAGDEAFVARLDDSTAVQP